MKRTEVGVTVQANLNPLLLEKASKKLLILLKTIFVGLLVMAGLYNLALIHGCRMPLALSPGLILVILASNSMTNLFSSDGTRTLPRSKTFSCQEMRPPFFY